MTTNNHFSMSSIVTVDNSGMTVTPSTKNETLNFGGLKIDTWANNSGMRVAYVGDDCKGKEAIELVGFEAVAGFYNAAMKLHDDRESFGVLKIGVHIYGAAAKREYAQAAGYVSVEIADENLGGLMSKVWRAVRKEGGSYAGAGLIQPVSYAKARTWGKKAQDENEHKHHIVALHNGIDAVLRLAAGTHFVTFKTFDWTEDSKARIAAKEFAMRSTKEYRATQREDAITRKEFGTVHAQVRAGYGKGWVSAEQAHPASYINLMQEEVTCTLQDMVGMTFETLKKDGSPLSYYKAVNTVEEAATALGLARKIEGCLRAVES